ncbi:MAG: hypothetical protein HC880_21695 [Bacteroidia bacterium]|nr:hypothetical protein [Bacteroidia bacterium]
MAQFGLEQIVPNDASVTADQVAELYFYQGMAHMYMGEFLLVFLRKPLAQYR